MKISIAYITAREEPHLAWLIDGLEQQAKADDKIELIVVDALGRPARSLGFRPLKAIRNLIETKPKPTAWQGAHRCSPHDFYANANARNTALVLCRSDYVCFLDDRCKLDAGWLDQVRRGEHERESVICGTYTKHTSAGVFVDHRRQIEARGKKGCCPEWTYGCNVALPLEWALEVNGFEEGCDPIGLEDCIFGHMLHNIGHRADFLVEMSVQQDRHGYLHPLHFPRQHKGAHPNSKSDLVVRRFQGRKRTELTPDLRAIRASLIQGGTFPLPDPNQRDWYDDSLVRNARLAPTELELCAMAR